MRAKLVVVLAAAGAAPSAHAFTPPSAKQLSTASGRMLITRRVVDVAADTDSPNYDNSNAAGGGVPELYSPPTYNYGVRASLQSAAQAHTKMLADWEYKQANREVSLPASPLYLYK